MNNKQRLNFIAREVDAISTELEPLFQQVMLLNDFIKDVSKVAQGAVPSYNFNEVTKKINNNNND